MVQTGLAVLEARWWEDGNDSVRPLFETLSGIVENNPHGFRYDMFADKSSLTTILEDIACDPIYHAIYIASHGDDNSIRGIGDNSISRVELRNIFRNCNKDASISGLYFGSCLVANESNSRFLLTQTPKTGLDWVAGYNKAVDWIDSSAVDMVFWSKYLHERKTNRSRRKNKKSDVQMIKSASTEMKKLMPTVFNELGFNVYHLDSGGELAAVW
jgi:hypothetical protein